jgi:flagellin
MIINHNMGAMNANRMMGINANNASKSMEKLSSGLRINKAGDDAAGLAISEKMRGQIRGLDQAAANSQDGISMIQTAEGALNENHSILQRMRELAVQAGNDTNTTSDRKEIQKEMNQLTSEINRIGNTTEFNTQKLIDGSASSLKATQGTTGTNLGNVANIKVSNVETGSYTLTIEEVAAAKDATLSGVTAGGANTTTNTSAVSLNAGRTAGDVNYEGKVYVSVGATGAAGTATLNFGTTAGGTDLGAGVSWATSGTAVALSGDATGVQFTLTNAGGAQSLAAGDTWTFDITKKDTQDGYLADIGGAKTSFANSTSGVTVAAATGGTISFDSGDISAMTAGSGNTETIAIDVAEGDGKLLQIGANQNQNFNLSFSDMRAAALKITGSDANYTTTSEVTNGISSAKSFKALSVADNAKASNAVKVIDDAISSVSAERSKLGAYTNRLEHTINNLGTSSENLTSAESRIRDVNMAKEMSTFSKNNILSQAAQAMLAQANQQPQQVLQLLR